MRPLFDKGLDYADVYSIRKGLVLLSVPAITRCVDTLLAVDFWQLSRLLASCLALHIEFYYNVF